MSNQTNITPNTGSPGSINPANLNPGNGDAGQGSPGADNHDSLQQRQDQRRAGSTEAVLRPAVDIYETGDGITLQADMPGVSRDGLNLRVEGNSLLVEGTIGITPHEQMSPLHADVRSTLYRRSFHLSNELETGKIEANLKDGLLTVRIPKRAELRPRRIEIQS